MRWQMGRRSNNVEDRRGAGSSQRMVAGGSVGVIVIAIVAMLLGVDPAVILEPVADTAQQGQQQPDVVPDGSEDQLADFSSVVLADTEDTWSALFAQMGEVYQEPKLVLFTQSVDSACGFAQAAMGPFYCPADQKVYIDLSFYQDLRNLHQAPGDFAQAYVIAHEVGHHVQTLLGISQQVGQMKQRVSKVEANQLSVRQELQADCFAGIWAHHADKARQILEQGDIEEALQAASQIGDDRLQRQSQGYVAPETFTHGSSEQRVSWFNQGLQTGRIEQCNTFAQL